MVGTELLMGKNEQAPLTSRRYFYTSIFSSKTNAKSLLLLIVLIIFTTQFAYAPFCPIKSLFQRLLSFHSHCSSLPHAFPKAKGCSLVVYLHHQQR